MFLWFKKFVDHICLYASEVFVQEKINKMAIPTNLDDNDNNNKININKKQSMQLEYIIKFKRNQIS